MSSLIVTLKKAFFQQNKILFSVTDFSDKKPVKYDYYSGVMITL